MVRKYVSRLALVVVLLLVLIAAPVYAALDHGGSGTAVPMYLVALDHGGSGT